ncbi:hypothetical protein [Pseudonocardia sp. MH-G8]|uniref:hypothetical protein n=1 Tax=Pseudonocardia sp. MH-G8 TaxID=1854588 RepID=UPI00117B7A1F|nr:hypothetical protein [Pseudonocardia sp. MH-G8]
MRKELNAAVRRGAKPMAQAVKAGALALPAETGQSTGLRASMAAATRFSNTARGAFVMVDSSRMPGDQATLPVHTDSGAWRHPVFGSDTWVSQTSRADWFATAALSQSHVVEREVGEVLDKIADRIGGAVG